MATADQLYNRFVDTWNAGERPDVDDLAAQLPENERAQFLRMTSLFLQNAPTPPYSDEQREAVLAEPAVQKAMDLAGTEHGLWPKLLPHLRERAKLTRAQLVAQLADKLGHSKQEERVRVYYHEMESGQLDPAGVSRRVFEALAKVLGVAAREIEDAGDFRGLGGAEPETMFARSVPAAADEAVWRAPALEVGDTELDEVDRLFRGGR